MSREFPILDTKRLRLRELAKGDAEAIFAIHADVEGMRWFGSDPMKELSEAEQLIDIFADWRKLPNPGVRWGIERLDDGNIIGTCGLFKWNRAWRVCTIGYELAQHARNQGFMQEALASAITWGMQEMALNRVEAQIYPENVPSIKLAEKLGFRFEGILRQLGHWQEQFHDLGGYALLRNDWHKQRNVDSGEVRP